MKSYILKEYGSWSVLIMSYIAGLIMVSVHGLEAMHVLVLLPLVLIMNSKQAFSRWIKNRSTPLPLIIFIAQIVIAATVLFLIFETDLFKLLPMLLIPLIYLVLYALRGEHFIGTEIAGFAILTLAAPIAVFTVTGTMDLVSWLVPFFFFTAGVFKVRIFLKKRTRDRITMVLYVLLSGTVFLSLGIPALLLLPLLENLYFALFAPKVKLSTVGWTEVLKGMTFLVLIGAFFHV